VTAMPGNPSNAADDAARSGGGDLEFLIVDDFLGTIVDARALKTAFELGLVDRLAEHRRGSVERSAGRWCTDAAGLRFLLDLLAANG